MVILDGETLSIEDIWHTAVDSEPCELADMAREKVRRGRALVEKLAAEPRAIYGINTGFGPLSATRIKPEDIALHQLHLLHHLSVGQGDLFSPAETRAIMVTRTNVLARGHSGVREEIVDLLLDVLNKGILPEIPKEGSVGASGDLVPLAHMSRLLVGLGSARHQGRRLPAAEALRDAGLEPIELRSKEGLALVNGTSVMTALAALSCREAVGILGWMELMTACLVQALFGEAEEFDEPVHLARNAIGQIVCARRIADHLRSHPDYRRDLDEHAWQERTKPVEPGVEVQDPYSLRCVPQILGPFQEALWHAQQVTTAELNSSTDNPLVFAESGIVQHGGNFYGQGIGMTSDYLRLGIIKSVLLADRHIERLVDPRLNRGLPPMLTGAEPGLNSGLMGSQLLATNLAAESRLLGSPGSIQTIPTNASNQDVVSMGLTAAKMTRTAIAHAWKILAIEALALAQAGDLRARGGKPVMGGDYDKLHELVRSVSPELHEDRPLADDIARVADLLQDAEVQARYLPPRPEGDEPLKAISISQAFPREPERGAAPRESRDERP